MARPQILRSTYIDIAVEEPALSGTFVTLCGLTTKSFTAQKNSEDQFIADCADPEDIPVRYLNITGRQWDISGEALWNRAQGVLMRSLADESTSRTFRFIIDEPATSDVDDGYYEGPAQLVNLQISGSGSTNATGSVAIASDGEFVWVDAA